jgi:integrase
MRYPFTLVKIKSKVGTMWHARFWDESLQKYAHSRTTGILAEGKKEHRREAEDVAKKLYDEFTESKSTETKPTVTQSEVPAAQIPQGNPTSQQTSIVADTPLIEYLSNFWTPNSEYAQFKRNVDKKPLSFAYVENNHEDIRRHVQPYPGFSGVTVGSVNKALLKKWLIWLAGRKGIRHKKDGTIIEGETITGRRANIVIQAFRVAIRWAVDNEEIPIDPFRKLGEVSETKKDKGVLTFAERKKLTELPVIDYRSRLMMLLGGYCGLRRGEMRGLKWGDIANGIITIQHNYQNKEGLKKPKYDSVRKVPITTAIQELLDIVKNNAFNISPNSYVLESPLIPGKPISNNFFRDGVKKELIDLGISAAQQRERFLTCHSLRHTFITLAQLSGISDVEIRALAGHKSEKVMNQYSHVPQVLDYNEARKKLEANGINVPKAANG